MKLFSISNAIFLIFSMSVVAFATYQYSRDKEEKKQKTIVFSFVHDQQDILQVSMTEKNSLVFSLKKQDSQWQFQNKNKKEASKKKINDFLKKLLSQEVVVIAENNIDWKDYGLGSLDSFLKIKTAHQESKIWISDQMSFDDRTYLRRENQLLIGSSEWNQFFDTDFNVEKKKLPEEKNIEKQKEGVNIKPLKTTLPKNSIKK